MGVRDRMSSTARKSTEEYDDEGAMKVDTSSSVKNDNMTSEMTVKDISVLISEESNATLFDSKSSAKLGGEHHSNEKEKLEEVPVHHVGSNMLSLCESTAKETLKTDLSDNSTGDIDATGPNTAVLHALHQPISLTLFLGVFTMCLQPIMFGLGIGTPNNASIAMQWNGVVNGTFSPEPATFEPPLSDDVYSWITSLLSVGGAIGGLCGGKLVQVLGPKWTSIGTDVVFLVSGLILGLASNSTMLIVGRIILGIGAGLCCASVPLYANDCAPMRYRGAFGTLHQIHINTGIVIAAALGMDSVVGTPELWYLLWGLPVVLSVLHAVLMFWLPDSPQSLYDHGKPQRAQHALQQIRGHKYDTQVEMSELARNHRIKEDTEGTLSTWKALSTLFSPLLRQRIVHCLIISISQQLCGINAIMFYSSSIFQDAGVENTQMATLLVAAVLWVTTFPSSFIIERAGRKVLLMVGFGGMGLSLVMFVVCVSMDWSWPSVVCILFAVTFFSFGPGPIPWLIVPEILPDSHREVGVGITLGLNWFFSFVVGQVYPSLDDWLGAYSFLPFAVVCAFVTAFVAILVPETAGLSLQEINQVYTRRAGHPHQDD